MLVKIFPLGYCNESQYTRVVCVSKYKNKYVFVHNKIRKGWEIPGGHIENGETIDEAIRREMYEETGTLSLTYKPVCVYKIDTYGLLCSCTIKKLTKLPNDFEMDDIMFSETLPLNLTYPDAHKLFFDIVTRND